VKNESRNEVLKQFIIIFLVFAATQGFLVTLFHSKYVI